MKLILFLTLLSFSSLNQPPGKKLILITGSDWCQNCRFLETNVLKDSNFISFSIYNHIQIDIADFPQRISQSDSIKRQAAKTADFCQFNGEFPGVYLLDLKDSSLKKIDYNRENASQFSQMLLP